MTIASTIPDMLLGITRGRRRPAVLLQRRHAVDPDRRDDARRRLMPPALAAGLVRRRPPSPGGRAARPGARTVTTSRSTPAPRRPAVATRTARWRVRSSRYRCWLAAAAYTPVPRRGRAEPPSGRARRRCTSRTIDRPVRGSPSCSRSPSPGRPGTMIATALMYHVYREVRAAGIDRDRDQRARDERARAAAVRTRGVPALGASCDGDGARPRRRQIVASRTPVATSANASAATPSRYHMNTANSCRPRYVSKRRSRRTR